MDVMKDKTILKTGYKTNQVWVDVKKNIPTYILLLPAILLVLFFCYLPMPGILMAFEDYDFFKGLHSPWVGLKNIMQIVSIPQFGKAVLNTVKISILNLAIVFPAPIIFALLINEMRAKLFKRVVQTVSYLPYFLSWAAIIGMSYTIYSTYGLINDMRVLFGGVNVERIMFLSKQELFVFNIIILNLWRSVGWNSIIYLATMTSIDPQLYEAADLDGAGKFKQCLHITIPGISPTIFMLLILAVGQLFNDNFELIYGLQNPFINFDVISTVIYKQGIAQGEYAMATAFGFIQGLVGFVLMASTNYLSKKINGVAIW